MLGLGVGVGSGLANPNLNQLRAVLLACEPAGHHPRRPPLLPPAARALLMHAIAARLRAVASPPPAPSAPSAPSASSVSSASASSSASSSFSILTADAALSAHADSGHATVAATAAARGAGRGEEARRGAAPSPARSRSPPPLPPSAEQAPHGHAALRPGNDPPPGWTEVMLLTEHQEPVGRRSFQR